MNISTRSDVPAVKLPADLGIENIAEVQQVLLRHVDSAEAQILDGADVARIHTAALQLFCMFCEDRRRAGRETHWREPSEALRGAAALLGVTTLLKLSREGA